MKKTVIVIVIQLVMAQIIHTIVTVQVIVNQN